MKTPAATLLLPLVLIACGPAFAQPVTAGNAAPAGSVSPAKPAGSAASADSDGDRAWAAVVSLRTASATAPAASAAAVGAPAAPGAAAPVPFAPSAATLAEAKARAVARVQSSRQTAAAAKDFYTRFPAHAQAPAARKLEALAGLAGIADDDKPHEKAALKTAGDFRINKSNPIADRYEVAHAVERHVVSRKLGGKSWLSSPFESEAMADRLRGEFGHLPQVDANYLAVAQHTQCDHSREVALRILQMPVSPSTKAAAQRVVDRANLMRKPLDFSLTTAAGATTRLATLAGSGGGKRTVVVFWDGVRSPGGPLGLHPYVQKAPPNTQWVYVSLGAWTPPPKSNSVAATGPASANANAPAAAAPNANAAKAGPPAIRASAAPPGTYCVEPLGMRSAVAQQLKISSLPFVCVLDDQMHLNAFGRVDEIPALLAGLNRLLEQ